MNWMLIVLILLGIAVTCGLFFGIICLLMLLFKPADFKELFASKKRIKRIRQHAIEIAKQFNITDPPDKFCPECGQKLTWYWHSVDDMGYDITTGQKQYLILAKYVCPNGHFPGAAGNGVIHLTSWPTFAEYWKWAL